MDKFIKRLSEVCIFDIHEEGLEPHVEINRQKIVHIAKDKVISLGREKDFTDISGLTLYKTLDKHIMASLHMFITDMVGVDKLLDHTKMGELPEIDKYTPIYGDTIEEWVDKCRESQDIVTQLRLKKEIETSVGLIDYLEEDVTLGKNPSFNTIVDYIRETHDTLDGLSQEAREAKKFAKKLQEEVKSLSDSVSVLTAKTLMAGAAETEIEKSWDGVLPSGKIENRKASEVFSELTFDSDFEVPFFEWDGYHPNVPAVDESYVFRPRETMRVLYAIAFNKRAWLQGHTGSGKTTLVQQVCARLGMPCTRVNFDSEITRSDLMGRDTLTVNDEGATISRFEEGILPRAMQQPGLLLCDEMDFVRADVSYVLQAALEGNNLRIAEDGDRIVTPHPMFRMMATANTVGQGDEEGMYQGARAQSLALLDRFTVWIKVDYMNEEERKTLLDNTFGSMREDDKMSLLKYFQEHLEGFKQGDILQPISPRGLLAIAQACLIFGNLRSALEMCVIDKASSDDKSTLLGLVDRVTK